MDLRDLWHKQIFLFYDERMIFSRKGRKGFQRWKSANVVEKNAPIRGDRSVRFGITDAKDSRRIGIEIRGD